MAKIVKNEEFISIWQHETCLWDVGAKVYKDRNEKAKSINKLQDALGLTGVAFSIRRPYLKKKQIVRFFKFMSDRVNARVSSD